MWSIKFVIPRIHTKQVLLFFQVKISYSPTATAISHPPVSATELDPSIAEPVDAIQLTPKPKLKPLHWDKVRASSDREMVWDQLRCSSFKLDEEIIETLFVVNKPNNPTPKEPTTKLVDS